VLTGTVVTPGGGTNTQTQGISSHDTGVTLQVNARVNPSGVVTLIIDQEVSNPTATTTSNIPTPSFDQQVVQTQITVQDGDTVAIGGLISENTNSGSSGIPGLNRVPYVGGFFGNKTYSHDRTELIIFMTPTIFWRPARSSRPAFADCASI
jgi:general secretion pathway protein D